MRQRLLELLKLLKLLFLQLISEGDPPRLGCRPSTPPGVGSSKDGLTPGGVLSFMNKDPRTI